MIFRKTRILVTTTFGAIRFVKGGVIDIDEDTARHLIALGKAEIVSYKQSKDEPAAGPDAPTKAKRKD